METEREARTVRVEPLVGPTDLLDMGYINSLPQPLWARYSGTWWPVNDIEVQTGLLRIDVCGMLDVLSIGGVLKFRDARGAEHDPDDFYADPESWINRKTPNASLTGGAAVRLKR